jgi:hypothetical protein
MNPWQQNKALWVLILLLVLGGYFLFRGGDASDREMPREDEEVEVGEDEISVNGTITCLTFRSATPEQDCVKALKGDDNKMYALNSTGVNGAELSMPEGTKVTAVGVFEPANTSVDDASVFRYDGVLILSSLKRR